MTSPSQQDSASLTGAKSHLGPIEGLPPVGTVRWVGRRKASVVDAIRSGVLTLEDACERYGLTVEELMSWQRLLDHGGTQALRTTRLQQYRRKSNSE